MNLYAYVANRPTMARDPLGLWLINASDQPVIVKPEEDSFPLVVVAPKDVYRGNIDGVKSPGGNWFKVSGKYFIYTDVTVMPDGSYDLSGLGSFIPQANDPRALGWRDQLPGIKFEPDWTRRHPDWAAPSGGVQICRRPMCDYGEKVKSSS